MTDTQKEILAGIKNEQSREVMRKLFEKAKKEPPRNAPDGSL